MAPAGAVDVLIVSLGSTEGLRRADEELAAGLRRAGASVALVRAGRPPALRTLALTDLAWALSARHAARAALARRTPRAVLYSTTTAALLAPVRGAIRFDAPALANRPGRHGLWQRPLERRRLERAPALLPWSEGALAELPEDVRLHAAALVVPVPVEACGAAERRDVAAITYAANPLKKGLDRVLAAWRRARESGVCDGDQLLVAGTSAAELARARIDLQAVPGVRLLGPLSTAAYRALVARARVFVCAPRREDYGIAQLEALADGCQLVTTPAPGPYAALPIARELDPRLVGEDLTAALRAALERPRPDYAERAAAALAPFSRDAVDAVIARRLLPLLLD